MAIQDRMDKTGTVKRGDGTFVSDGAGGFVQGNTAVASAVKYARWLPGAYARSTIRAEQGLKPDAEVYNASIEYKAAFELHDRDWIVEDSTGYFFRIVGAQLRTGMGALAHHWSAVLVKLQTEPVE